MTRAGLVLVGIFLVAAAAVWRPLERSVFHGDARLTALLVVGVVVYGVSYVIRGVIGGLRWFRGYAIVLLADAAGRLLIALPLLLSSSTVLAGAAVAGAGLCGAVAPLALGRARLAASLRAGVSTRYRLGNAASFAAPAAVIAACDQLLVNGPPLLVAADGASSRAVGLVFAATMLLRAPVYVFQGLAASLLPNFTHLRGSDRLRAQIVRLVLVLTAIGASVVLGAAAAGPQIMRILYGDRYVVSRPSLVLLGVAVAAYLVAATLSQALLAAHRVWTAAAAWLTMVACFVAGFAVLSGGELTRIAVSLAAATVVGAALLACRVLLVEAR